MTQDGRDAIFISDELREPEGRLLAVRVPPGLPPHGP